MAGIIHHGGSGTTHTSAKAGIPQFILPQFMDQYYWGHRIQQMGLGPKPVIPRRIRSADLAKAFDDLTKEIYKKNTSELAEKMKDEDRVKRSIDIILNKPGFENRYKRKECFQNQARLSVTSTMPNLAYRSFSHSIK